SVKKGGTDAREKSVLAPKKSPRQSFAARRRQNRVRICFFQGHEPWKNTSQPASVRALRVRRSGLHSLEKMLAFLRSVSSFLDTLRPAA
ncbi:MAG: hypothetical protein MSB10_01500, partial [Clostridiales bacterium]|nr:hypothetical protein [Clostridiales bacterium]